MLFLQIMPRGLSKRDVQDLNSALFRANNDPQNIYIALVASGLLLLGVEIFVPGGVLGMIGGLALMAAMVVGFHPEVFGVEGGLISAILIVLVTAAYVFVIMKFLPKSPIGRLLTLQSMVGRACNAF